MLQSFTISKCRADNTEVEFSARYKFTIAEKHMYPAQTTTHPVTGIRHIPADLPQFPEITFPVPTQGNTEFLAAARNTFRDNRYEAFRLVAEDGTEIMAPIQGIRDDAQGHILFTVHPQL